MVITSELAPIRSGFSVRFWMFFLNKGTACLSKGLMRSSVYHRQQHCCQTDKFDPTPVKS